MKTTPPARKSVIKSRGAAGDGLLLKLELPSDPSLLCAVRGAVERLTDAFGFSAAECRSVTRAVDEALTNIIRHAYSGAPDQPIELSIRAISGSGSEGGEGQKEGLEIVMSDRGPAVDPQKMCGRELSDVKPGGLGLHFIKQSMDVVEFKRVDGANQLRLVKYMAVHKEMK